MTIVHSKKRPQIMNKVEKLLLILIKEKKLHGNSISEDIICEKALCIHADLLKELPVQVQKVNVGSFSKPLLTNSNTKMKSIVLLGMERQPAQTRMQPNCMLANSATSKMQEFISHSKCLIVT